MLNKKYQVILVSVIFFASITAAQAGFGVSPPAVVSDRILPGSRYTQTITLLRSDPADALNVKATIIAPEIDGWISLDKGDSFVFPAGATRIPLTVIINAPRDAQLGAYSGAIEISAASDSLQTAGGINLALGAQVRIDITLINDIYREFTVRASSIADVTARTGLWRWLFFSKVMPNLRLSLRIENSGNVSIAPSRIEIDIYDITETELLVSETDRSMKKIPEYQTENIIAAVPISLLPGQYWAKIRVFQEDDITAAEKIAFTVVKPDVFDKTRVIEGSVLLALLFLILIWAGKKKKTIARQAISASSRIVKNFRIANKFFVKIRHGFRKRFARRFSKKQ